MKKTFMTLIAGLFCLAFVRCAEAQVVNGGFETGDFSSWTATATDSTEIEDSGFGTGPTEGTYDALIDNGGSDDMSLNGGSLSIPDLETFLGLSSGSIAALDSPNDPVIGNAISQTFNASAGQKISFDWNFLSNENPQDGEFNDFSFYTLNGQAYLLGDLFSPSLNGSGSNYYLSETGFDTVNIPISADGSYTLGFGVVSQGDDGVASGLLVDNVQLSGGRTNAVPEPASLLLMSMGGLGLFFRRRFAA